MAQAQERGKTARVLQPYGYSRYCELYRAWAARLSPTMRQSHVAGERMFVDYAGTMLTVYASTGEVMTAQLFVAVLGASRSGRDNPNHPRHGWKTPGRTLALQLFDRKSQHGTWAFCETGGLLRWARAPHFR
jgi:transposase